MISASASSAPYDRAREALRKQPKVWLVTGAAGFIGSNLVEELLDLGQRVVGLDDFSTGYEANIDAVLAGRPSAADRFHFIRGDIRDLAACRAACARVDYVLHQAALASVPRSIHNPIATSEVNVGGFLNVLVAARDAGVRRVVYASSSSVYGDARTVPQVEERVGRVLSPYAASKATNEMYAAVFQRTYGLEAVGLRYFNVFGRRQDPNGAYAAVIPRWASALLAGQSCQIFGDGETSRDFCYIANTVQANLLAAVAGGAEATGQVYNVACGRETSLNRLFELIRSGVAAAQPSAAGVKPTYGPERAGDIRRSLADITRAREALGYDPAYTVEQGLAAAIEWYVTSARASAAADAEASRETDVAVR